MELMKNIYFHYILNDPRKVEILHIVHPGNRFLSSMNCMFPNQIVDTFCSICGFKNSIYELKLLFCRRGERRMYLRHKNVGKKV